MLPSLLTVPTKVGRHVVSDDSDKMIAIYVRTLIRTVKSFNFVLVIGRLSIVGLIILIVGFSVRTVYNDSPLANVSMVLKIKSSSHNTFSIDAHATRSQYSYQAERCSSRSSGAVGGLPFTTVNAVLKPTLLIWVNNGNLQLP